MKIQSIVLEARWIGLFCSGNPGIHVSESEDRKSNENLNTLGMEKIENGSIIKNCLKLPSHHIGDMET